MENDSAEIWVAVKLENSNNMLKLFIILLALFSSEKAEIPEIQNFVNSDSTLKIRAIFQEVSAISCIDLDEQKTTRFLESCTKIFRQEKTVEIHRKIPGHFSENIGFFIKISMETFSARVGEILQGKGTYLFLIPDTEISNSISKIFTRKLEANKLFFLINNTIFYFDPFEFDDEYQGHGKLIESTDRKSITNYKGFPLRTLMFKSTFALPIYDEEKRIISFQGVDFEIVKLLISRLNLTSEFSVKFLIEFLIFCSNLK